MPVPPPLPDLLAAAHVVALPMRVRFRGVDVREAVLLDGPAGWSEFAPFVEYPDHEAAAWLAAAVESGWGDPPPVLRESVPVNATVPAVAADDVASVLERFPGCRTAKVKVAEAGQDVADDVARVTRVRELMGAEAAVRVDANGAWSVDEAHRALTALAEVGLQYAEQPCRTVPELVDLADRLRRNGIDVPLAADESIRKAEDPLVVAASGAIEVAVLKVAPLGGTSRLLEVAARLRAELAVRVVVSSALDTSVGIAAGVRAAAALPDLDLACGLGTAGLLAADVTAQPLLTADGALPVRDVDVDRDRLERWAAPPDRQQWWRDRLSRSWSHLERTAA